MNSAWPVVSLDEVALIGAGNPAPQDPKLFKDGHYRFIRTADVGAVRFGSLTTSQDALIDEGRQGLKLWRVGTILLPKSGASTFLNYRVIMEIDGYVASHLATVVAKPERSIPRYLLYYLLTVKAQDLIQDHSYPSLRLPEIGAIRLPLPPIPEQKGIVAILDEAFEGIGKAVANAEKNLASARELFDSYLTSIFAHRDASWDEKTLKQVSTTFGRGKSRHRPRNDPKLYGGRYPFIQTGEVRNCDHIILESTQTYNESGLAQSKIWPKGTICITIAANIAETGILGFDACFPDSIIGVVVDPNETTNDFVRYLLEYVKAQLKAEGKGSAQDNINLATFESRKFPFPPLIKQKQFVEALSYLSTKVRQLQVNYEQKLIDFAELKQAILHKAFAGELTKPAVSAVREAAE